MTRMYRVITKFGKESLYDDADNPVVEIIDSKTGEVLTTEDAVFVCKQKGKVGFNAFHRVDNQAEQIVNNIEEYLNELDMVLIDGDPRKFKSKYGLRKYSKLYHRYPVRFSCKEFLGHWYDLCLHLTQNSNAVYVSSPKSKRKIRLAHTLEDLASVCDTSYSTIQRFYKEAYRKNYIAIFKCASKGKLYIVNPKHAFNGNMMPTSLFNLFEGELKIGHA